MSDEVNTIFSRNLAKYLSLCGMSQNELAQKMGVSTSTVSNWVNGINAPRMGKVDRICEILGISRSQLITDKPTKEAEYYLNPETKQIAQDIYEDKELRLLFSAARNASPEDLKALHSMLKALKAKEERHEN